MAVPPDTESPYGPVTRILHWAIAVLIVALIPLGWYMIQLDYYDPWSHDTLEIHRVLGMVVLPLGGLAETALVDRLAAMGLGFAVFYLSRHKILLAVAAGAAFFMALTALREMI